MDFQKPGSGHLEGLSGVAKSSFLGGVWSYHLVAWIRGWGGQPNLGNACILGLSGPVTPPLVYVQTGAWEINFLQVKSTFWQIESTF